MVRSYSRARAYPKYLLGTSDKLFNLGERGKPHLRYVLPDLGCSPSQVSGVLIARIRDNEVKLTYPTKYGVSDLFGDFPDQSPKYPQEDYYESYQ